MPSTRSILVLTILIGALTVLFPIFNSTNRLPGHMPSLATARASNAKFRPTYRPVGLFFGGTSGIGQAMAEQLANQTSGNTHIVLLGRNKEAAEKIIASFPKSESSLYEFERVDATSMKDVRRVTSSLLGRLDKVNYIVATTGFLTTKGRDETEEGLDKKLSCHFYGRFRFIYDLLPLLEKAAEKGEDTGVMSVLDAGSSGRNIDLDDLGLKKHYSLANAVTFATASNDAVLTELASRYPKIPFFHTYPGVVETPIITNFHWSLKYIAPAFRWAMVTPEACAQFMWSPLWAKDPKYKIGAHRIDNHGESYKPNNNLTPEIIQKVFSHAVEATDK